MRAVLQRVKSASVTIQNEKVGEIADGILLFLGITEEDGEKECDFLAEKAVQLRIFEDEEGKMNRSLLDMGGKMLIVSQFTLFADCRRGRRPSFIKAARPQQAEPLYERFIQAVQGMGVKTASGRFGADMLVSLENDGPVTILLDTEECIKKGE